MPAAQRREQLLGVALQMARESGPGSLTLARVAEASGVSKPIAYQHFGSLPGLLQAMYERICAEYEAAIVAKLADRGADEVDPAFALRDVCEAYVACSLEGGAMQDAVGTALATVEDAGQSSRLATADRYAEIVTSVFGLEPPHAFRLAVAFIGAADRICEAVIVGRVTPDEATGTLVDLFTPQLTLRS